MRCGRSPGWILAINSKFTNILARYCLAYYDTIWQDCTVTFHILPLLQELRQIRQRSKASQSTVASKAGLNATYLSKIERAQVDPRLSTVQDIARALDHEIIIVPRNLVGTVRSLMPSEGEVSSSLITIEPD